PAVLASILPACLHHLHRLDGGVAVVDALLARLVPLGAAEIPEKGIGTRRRIAEAVAEGLAHRLAFGLELLAHLAPLVPGLGELLDADLRVPGPSVGDGVSPCAMWDGQPAIADLRGAGEDAGVAALRLAAGLGPVRDVQ